jgi:hypothetical protein
MALTSLNPNLLGTDSSGASKLSTAGGLVQLHSTGVFTIANTSANTLFISNTGSVGIGTASPSGRFTVSGGLSFLDSTANGTSEVLKLNNSATAAGNNAVKLSFCSSGVAKGSISTAVYGEGYMAFATNDDTEKMRITAGGNVGIGTNSPNALLTLAQNTAADTFLDVYQNYSSAAYAAYLRLNTANLTGSRYSGIVSASGGATQWQITGGGSDNTLAFATGSSGTERMRITSTGDVGIGTNSPIGKTDIRGNFYINNSTSNQTDKRAFFQTITGVLTSAASGTAKSIAYVFHHHCIRIYIMVSSQDNNCSGGTWIGRSNFVCGSGSTTQETTQTYYSGGGTNLSGISVNYQNGSGENSSYPNYIIRVTNTYTGTTPIIWYAIEGLAADTMVALQN